MPIASLDEIRSKVGSSVGVSDWIEVGQDRISAFADATEDHQFIHVDPAAAAAAGLGGTIAHGFLSLSLLSRMAADAMLIPDTSQDGAQLRLRPGPRSSRRSSPASGCGVSFTLDSATEKAPGQLLLNIRSRSRSRARTNPPLTAEWLGLIFI